MKVKLFQHLIVRLISLLFATCMSEISLDKDEPEKPDDPMQVIDLTGINLESLAHLDQATRKCEVIVQWIAHLIVEARRQHIFDVEPPMVTRSMMDLAMATLDISRVRKIREVPFPFPYSQMVSLMLAVYTVVTPIVASQMIHSWIMATVATFCVTTAFWSLYQIADEIEKPFGTDDNDLEMKAIQDDFNQSLLSLMKPGTRTVPQFVLHEEEMKTVSAKKQHYRESQVGATEALPVIAAISESFTMLLEGSQGAQRVRKTKVKKQRRVVRPADSESEVMEAPIEVRVEGEAVCLRAEPAEQSSLHPLACSPQSSPTVLGQLAAVPERLGGRVPPQFSAKPSK